MANEVFISYSRSDYQKVRKIKETIDQKVGIDCWMDLDGIESHQQFLDVIIDAINRHDTILFMMSKDSMVSKWALEELSFAESKNKRIVLVRIDSAPMPDKFLFKYKEKQQISWDEKTQRNKLLRNLTEWFPMKMDVNEDPNKEPENKSKNGEDVVNDKKLSYTLIAQISIIAIVFFVILINILPTRFFNLINFISTVESDKNREQLEMPDDYFQKVRNVNHLWGFCSPDNEILIECKWKSVGIFSEGMAPVRNDSNKCGYIDKLGNIIIRCRFYNAGNFSEGLAKIMNSESKWGYINQEGKEVIPCEIPVEPTDFKNGTAVYKYEGTKYRINKNGLIIKEEAVDKPDSSADK